VFTVKIIAQYKNMHNMYLPSANINLLPLFITQIIIIECSLGIRWYDE